MISYISLLNKIEAFCNAHLQIKKYKGEFREQMPNFATTDEKYPVVFVVPTSDTETLELNQFTLDIYCVDIIQKDRANLNTIVSDCHLILKDLYLYFKDGSDLSVDVIADPTMTPLNNFDLDYVAGWVMTITFEVEGYSVCAIPMNPIPPFTPSCEDATYEITDTAGNVLYSGSVVSGGELNQAIQDSTITNSDGSYTGSVLAEGLSTLPDITVTDSNGSTYTQPSVTDVFCTPCEGVDVYVGEANVGSFPSGSDVFVKVIQDGLEVIPEDVTVVDDEVNIILADTPPCHDTNIEVNGVSEGSVVAGSTVDIQLSDSLGTVTPTSVTQVGNDFQIVLPDAVAPTGWQRPTGWLALDTVGVGTENFSGLFAVYETQKNVNTIQITTSGVNTINWGDGTTQTVTTGVLYTKVYDYSTITSPVLVDDAGLNYKMVVVNINMTGVSNLQIDRNTTATVIGNARNLGWLDIAVDCSTMTTFSPSAQGFATLLQRLLIYNVGTTISGTPSFVHLAALKVLKFPFDKLQSSNQNFVNNFGDCRDENNLPLNINLSINTGSGFNFLGNSHLTEIGNVTAPLTNSFQNFFFNSVVLQKVGNINASSASNLVSTFSNCVKLTGVINVTTSPILTSINTVLGGCFLVDGLIISDCTNVTSTVNAVVNCKNLKTLILTGLTRGITVDDCLMEATEINAFFTSLGTAVGSQTIFIRRNPGSATCDTTIATTKGFTVVIV